MRFVPLSQIEEEERRQQYVFVPATDFEAPKPSGFFSEVGSAISEGTQKTLRSARAALSTYLGLDDDVVEQAGRTAQIEAGSQATALTALKRDVQARKTVDDESIWSGIRNVAGAIADNPRGGAQLVAEQAPNAVVSLGTGLAGAKAGALIGAPLGPAGAAVGGTVGFLAGLFGANTLLETGNKAVEAAKDQQFTPEERSRVIREGAVKGGVITAVDAATLGASRFVLGAANRAVEQATARVLTDAGVDAQRAAREIQQAQRQALTSSRGLGREATAEAVEKATVEAMGRQGLLAPDLVSAVQAAQKSAFDTATTFGKRAGRGGTALTLETLGEGVGEGLGEFAATGEFSPTDAALESIAGLSMSVPELYVAKRLDSPGILTREMSRSRPAAEVITPPPANLPQLDQQLGQAVDDLTQAVDPYLAVSQARTLDEAIQAAGAATTVDLTPPDVLDAARERALIERLEEAPLQPGQTRVMGDLPAFPDINPSGLQPGQARLLSPMPDAAPAIVPPPLRSVSDLPRPTNIAGVPASTITTDRLRTIAADVELPAITRRGAQIELMAREQDEGAAPPLPARSMAPMEAPPAVPGLPQRRAAADREADLLAQADTAGTEFDRRMALEQIDAVRAPAREDRAAAGFVDLTPMEPLQARQRLAVLQDQMGDPLSLEIVPHPAQEGRLAIARRALPVQAGDLDLTLPRTEVPPAQAQAQLEAAALAGTERVRRAEDAPRQAMIDRALAGIEARGGVASPYEAEILRAANMGQPFDRVDPSLGRQASADEKLTAATGIAVGSEAGLGFGARSSTTQAPAPAPFQYADGRGRQRREETPAQDAPPADVAGAFVQQMRETATPAARAFVRDYEAGRIGDADVMQALEAQRGMAPSAQQRLEDAAGQAPSEAQGLQVAQGLRARGVSPVLAEAVALYGGRPYTEQDLTVEGATQRVALAGTQTRPQPMPAIPVEQGLSPRAEFPGREASINTGAKLPRPSRVGGEPAGSLSDERLRTIASNEALPAVTRRSAQIEIMARAQEQRGVAAAPMDDAGARLQAAAEQGRLAVPAPGRIITTGARFSTQRAPVPGTTLTIRDALPETDAQGSPVRDEAGAPRMRTVDHEVRVVEASALGNTGRLMAQVARIFGKKLVVFESDTLQSDGFVKDDDAGSIYINAKSSVSPLAVFGHEMTHLLKRDNAQAYGALEAVVQRTVTPLGQRLFEQEYGAGANLEELTSDLVGNRFQEADFWQSVFEEVAAQNPEQARGIITRMTAALVKAVNAFMKIVRQPGFTADMYVNDLQAVKTAVRTAFTQYAQSQRLPAMQAEGALAQAEAKIDLAAGSAPVAAGPQGSRREKREMGVPLVGQNRTDLDADAMPAATVEPEPRRESRPIAAAETPRPYERVAAELLSQRDRKDRIEATRKRGYEVAMSRARSDWQASPAAEVSKAEVYEERTGLAPYTSEGQIEVPLEGSGTRFSVKRPYGEKEYAKGRANDPLTGLPLNKNGTVTLYFPTSNAVARELSRTKRLTGVGPNANRIYLTNESSGPKVMNEPGNIDHAMDGANVLLQVDPRLLHLDREYPDGRKDFFIPIAEGQAYKSKMTKLFTLDAPRTRALSKDTKLTDLERRIGEAIAEYQAMDGAQRRERLARAKEVLKEEHNVGTLLGVNGKLEKTNTGGYGLNNYNGKDVMSMGLGLASAQKINEKNLSTCPNSAICEGLCLGETSGQNLLYGGEGQFKSGPRLAQYLKTEALVLHPEDFAIVLHSEIERFQRAAAKEDYQPTVRLNVTSDFRPQTFAGIINAFPGVMFYDYTKLPSNSIAPNHHLTYSSTGASQSLGGFDLPNVESNWDKLVETRLTKGGNVAMAFSSKTDMPEYVVDERTGQRFQVWNGDNYDARFLDPKPGQPGNEFGQGMIVGLTNKDRTKSGVAIVLSSEGPATGSKAEWGRLLNDIATRDAFKGDKSIATVRRWLDTQSDSVGKSAITEFADHPTVKSNGFFLDYDPERDGDTLVIRDQKALAEGGRRTIPLRQGATARMSRQRQTDTPEFRRWFGDSKVVDKNGEPLVVYHGGDPDQDIKQFAPSPSGVIWFSDSREYADFVSLDKFEKGQGKVYAVFLSLQNPFDLRGGQKEWEWLRNDKKRVDDLKAQGYDGVILDDTNAGITATSYIAFNPTQIKSAIGNAGTFDPANPDITASRRRSPLGFYSALEDGVAAIKTNAAPAAGWKDAIKGLVNKGQAKAEEVEWSGVNDWLDLQQGKVTRNQVAEYLRQGGVQVEETVLGGAGSGFKNMSRAEMIAAHERIVGYDPTEDEPDITDADLRERLEGFAREAGEADGITEDGRPMPKYGQYTLPGGENYREVLLTLPERKVATLPDGYAVKSYPAEPMARSKAGYRVVDKTGMAVGYNSKRLDGRFDTADEAVKGALESLSKGAVFAELRGSYRSSHWHQPNVLAHIRLNDRTDADGKRVLFVEEIQSDWGQDGKKKGFGAKLKDGYSIVEQEPGFFHLRQAGREYPIAIGSRANIEQEGRAKGAFESGPPAAPFVTARKFAVFKDGKEVTRTEASGREVKQRYGSLEEAQTAAKKTGGEARDLGLQDNTEGWLNLALKRVITMAAEGGYDRVAFTTGEQNAERFSLDKRLREIAYEPAGDGKYEITATDLQGREVISEDEVGLDRIEELVGKEIAEKVARDEGERDADGYREWRYLRGDNLKVEAKGMRAFYDTIVPTALKKLLPKVGGGQVGTVEMVRPNASRRDEILAEIEAEEGRPRARTSRLQQPGFDVTPAMREKVAEGVPLFSPRRNIFGQRMALANWTAPSDTKLDRFLYTMQDKQIDTKRVVQAIRAGAGAIDDEWNAYLQEELYHGRTAKQTKDFLGDELRPLLQDMQARGVSVADLETYLHNRHAEERNRQIARINPAMPDEGSGIKTADARAYLAGLDPAKRRAYEALARRVDAITAGTRSMLVASGLETQDTVDQWERTYGSYVPLMREDLDFALTSGGMGTGQGYQVRGAASRRATGSTRPVVDILANVAMQRERAVVRAEKARVARAVYGLAVQYPNTSFWLAVDPAGQKDPNKAMADLMAMGINPIDAQNIVEEPTQPYVDPRTGLVTQRVNPLLRNSDNVLAVRIDGQEKYVFFNANDERSQRMAAALKNLDADQLGRVMGLTAQVTRYFASINTQYNPIFGAINFLRDVQGAALNLSTTPIAGDKAKVLGNSMLALRGIYSDLRSQRAGRGPATGTWATLWEEFQREGGQTGFRDMFSRSEERAQALQAEIDRMQRKGYDPRRLVDPNNLVFGWLSDYNETMENAVRLAAYKAAKDRGMSAQQAASLAKNLTVNFNRKGQVATQAGALYAFFNASVQGTARLAETLKGPAGRKIVAGGLLLGTAQAMLLAAAGFDEDEPPEFVKERNLVIPTGEGKYLTIPMPLGFNVLPNTSRVITEWAMSGWRDPAKRVGQITGAFLEMFNPIGNAGWSVQTIAPTVADPLVALAENRDWTGKPIAKEDRSGTDPTPGYTRAKETASAFGKGLAEFLNLASGGTKYQPGLISPTPDQIDYLIGQATGGVGREALKIEQSITSRITGEELPPYKMPVLGRFYGDAKSSAAESNRFYANITRLNQHENEIEGRRKAREDVAGYLAENPEARLVSMANQVERQVQDLRRRKREMLERDASPESIKMIEAQITARMKRLNDRVRQVRDAETVE